MNPSPPVWINARMVSWPKNDQWVEVLTVTSPVTDAAETAVNMAS